MKLTLLSRAQCGLCDRVETMLEEMGLEFETVDIDSRPDLLNRYTDAIPVLMAGERELCRAPITRTDLLSAVQILNLGMNR